MNLFHSLLLIIGEIALGQSVLVFVGAALATLDGPPMQTDR
jgi:hypothetical protein